jgi:hypothetical protein
MGAKVPVDYDSEQNGWMTNMDTEEWSTVEPLWRGAHPYFSDAGGSVGFIPLQTAVDAAFATFHHPEKTMPHVLHYSYASFCVGLWLGLFQIAFLVEECHEGWQVFKSSGVLEGAGGCWRVLEGPQGWLVSEGPKGWFVSEGPKGWLVSEGLPCKGFSACVVEKRLFRRM